MEDKINQTREKITDFWRKSFKYYGKEITLDSNQHFSIDQIRNDENLQNGLYIYQIQYGFPQSGCISLGFSFNQESESFSIDSITVYAPPSDKEMIIANFAPQSEFDGLSVSANFGFDMGTEEHKSISSIVNNSNALKILDFAISDLNKAEILGECRLEAPIGSERIPMCHSTNKPLNKGKNRLDR